MPEINCREDFPIFKRLVNGKPLIYFDNAATTQRPIQVIEAIRKFYETYNANVHRGVHTLSYEATVAYEEAHKKVARFINARSWREIIFVRNASEALNLVMYAYALNRLQPGDEIVTTVSEHHSNLVPWFYLRDRKGVVLKFADVHEDGRLNLDHLRSLITEKTKIVTVIHASNITGVINPVKEIGKWAHEVGALFVVDGAQSVPHIPVNVQEIDADFFAASGHKMLGPTGIGFLYGKQEILEEMEPFLYGGDMIFEVTLEGATWNELPWKFEAGTPNIAGGIGLGAAVDYLLNIGMENIYAHEQALTAYALERLSEIKGLTIYGPLDVRDRLGVISFNIEGVHPHDIAHIFDAHGIAIRSGHHCAQPLMRRLRIPGAARASFYLYNTREEIDRMVEAIAEVQKLFVS